MLGLKLNHVSKRGPRYSNSCVPVLLLLEIRDLWALILMVLDVSWGWVVNTRCSLFNLCGLKWFYASAFGRRRHYIFGLSVHPSDRSPKYFFSPVHGSVGPSDQPWPWPFFSLSVRSSVRISFRAFPGERMEGIAWNLSSWCMCTNTPTTNTLLIFICWNDEAVTATAGSSAGALLAFISTATESLYGTLTVVAEAYPSL